MTEKNVEQRLLEIEKKVSFQDQQLFELSEALVDHQKKMIALERQLAFLTEQLTSGSFVKRIEDEEPPPHY